jgi:C1A family cysteine protease
MVEHDIPQDAGARISDGVRCLQTYGLCQESLWPYITSKFAIAPPQNCYTAAKQHKALVVHSIPNTLAAMKAAIASGFPFVVGIAVYESFETQAATTTGHVPLPKPGERMLGGHAVACVGYDDTQSVFIMRNSWGPQWGQHGYFTLPYAYLLNPSLTSDLWTITSVQ